MRRFKDLVLKNIIKQTSSTKETSLFHFFQIPSLSLSLRYSPPRQYSNPPLQYSNPPLHFTITHTQTLSPLDNGFVVQIALFLDPPTRSIRPTRFGFNLLSPALWIELLCVVDSTLTSSDPCCFLVVTTIGSVRFGSFCWLDKEWLVMETLVVVAQHKNQFYGRVRGYNGYYSSRIDSGGGRFRNINCRTNFQSGPGLLPSPPFEHSTTTFTTPVTKRRPRTNVLFRTPSPSIKNARSVDSLRHGASAVSSPIPISVKVKEKELAFDDEVVAVRESRGFSERWAGPAYSNSPPPSSLPIPKFSVKPKRTASLDLPVLEPDFGVELHATAKSAPASPAREHNIYRKDSLLSVDSATRTLRRILNLDVVDD